jgi:hypothetical protein
MSGQTAEAKNINMNIKKYNIVIEKIVRFAALHPDCCALLQIGSVKHPGLSDLDFVFVYCCKKIDGKKIEHHLKAIRLNSYGIPLDILHMPIEHLMDFPKIFYINDIKKLWGSISHVPIRATPCVKPATNSDEFLKRAFLSKPIFENMILAFLLQTPLKITRLTSMLLYPNADPRLALLLLSSLRHSIDIALQSFANTTQEIILFCKKIESLRKNFLVKKVGIKDIYETFVFFTSIWDNLMQTLAGCLRQAFINDLKSYRHIGPVFHLVSPSGICCFKTDKTPYLVKCLEPNCLDKVAVKWTGESLLGFSFVEMPMEALSFLLAIKRFSRSISNQMIFYPGNFLNCIHHFDNQNIRNASLAIDNIHHFYHSSCFKKGFPLAHYYNLGTAKRMKRILSLCKIISLRRGHETSQQI